MALAELTLSEIDLIATYVLRDPEPPFSAAFEAATSKFYGDDDFDPHDEILMGKSVIVDIPSEAIRRLPSRLYDVADDMDRRANAAASEHDYGSAQRLHRCAGTLRAIAVHIGRSA